MESVSSFLTWLEENMTLQDLASASGLLVEVRIAGDETWTQMIGPFSKDGIEASRAIQTLRSEEDPAELPNRYALKLLFPISSVVRP